MKRLRALAVAYDVRAEGRVYDVVPTTCDGRPTVEVIACPLHNVNGGRRFVIPGGEQSLVEDWKRWDRLTWREVATVDDLGAVTFSAAFKRLSDLQRTPNAGPVPFPLTKPTGGPVAFEAWLTAFARAAFKDDEKDSQTEWARGAAKLWLFPGTIVSVAGDRASVRLGADAYVDAYVPVKSKGRTPDFGVRYDTFSEQHVRRWGVKKDAELEAAIFDPQLAENLAPGVKVEIVFDLDASGATQAMGGSMPIRISVRRKR